MHAVININNFQIIDYSITDEHTNDARERIRIVRRIKNKIKKLYGDKGCKAREYCTGNNVKGLFLQ